MVDTKSSRETSDSTTKTVDTISQLPTVDTARFDYDSYFKLESYLTKNKIENEKFETIDFDCAILVYPTIEQIEEMKKEEGEEDFYIAADDINWYQGQAIDMIDSVGITNTAATGQFIRLKGKQETWDLDIRKKNLPAWNVIFFKTDKEPKIVSTVDLTVDEVRAYFNKNE
jgi:hypothetical protein